MLKLGIILALTLDNRPYRCDHVVGKTYPTIIKIPEISRISILRALSLVHIISIETIVIWVICHSRDVFKHMLEAKRYCGIAEIGMITI